MIQTAFAQCVYVYQGQRKRAQTLYIRINLQSYLSAFSVNVTPVGAHLGLQMYKAHSVILPNVDPLATQLRGNLRWCLLFTDTLTNVRI